MDEKRLEVILEGMIENVLLPTKIEIYVDKNATLTEIIAYLTSKLGKEYTGQSIESYYRHQGNYFMLIVNNRHVDEGLWNSYVPDDNSVLGLYSPLSDG